MRKSILSTAVLLATGAVLGSPFAHAYQAVKDLPTDTNDVLVHITGSNTSANNWNATVNGSSVDNSKDFYYGVSTDKGILPDSLKSLSVIYDDLQITKGQYANVGVAAQLPTTDASISFLGRNLGINNTSFYALNLKGNTQTNTKIDLNFADISTSGKSYVYGIYSSDSTEGSHRNFSSIEQRVDRLNGTGNFYGVYLKGSSPISAKSFDLTINDSSATSAYGIVGAGADLSVGHFDMNVTNSTISTAQGIYLGLGNDSKTGKLTLLDDFNLSLNNSSVGSVYGLQLATSDVSINGNISVNLDNTQITKDRVSMGAMLLFAPLNSKGIIEVNGDVALNATNSSSIYEFTTVQFGRMTGKHANYTTIFNNSDISLSLVNSSSSRIRTIVILNELDATTDPHLTLNNGNVSLFMDGVSTTFEASTDDDPSAINLGTNGSVKLNNSNVLVTLRANEKNALWTDSLYGIAMHGDNAKVDMTGDIVVTLEGDADNLGFGRTDDGGKTAVGGIYGFASNNKDATSFKQKGKRIIQFGTADHAFNSSAENGLIAPFANFTHVAVGEGSTLYLTNSQENQFNHDDALGELIPSDTGIYAKGGTLVIDGSNKPAETGLILGNNSTLHSNEMNFNGTSTVESTGSATLSSNQLNVDAQAVVNFKTNGSSENYAINLVGNVDNEGLFRLDESALAIDAGKDKGINLGKVETVGQNESAIYVGSGSLTVSDLKGDNKSVVVTDLDKTQSVVIENNTGKLNLGASSFANDQFPNVQEAAQALADKMSVENSDQTEHQFIVQEGAINDAASGTIDKDGNILNYSETKNERLDAFSSISALSALTLRHEMNSLTKRMGELRDAPAGVGAWVRGYGSELEYGAQNIKAKNSSIQVGSDYTLGDWKVGAAFSYTDGESTYDKGSADNKNYGIAVYGTWFVPCGAYVDLMAKYNRLDNDFALNGMNGSFDNDAFTVSAETGYRFNFMDGGVFVEPQVGLSYGQIKGETIKTSNGVTLEQDDYNSLIGRVGVRTGFKFPKDKGTIYARVSGVYDFDGEVNGKATLGQSKNTFEADLGGSWLEMGVGANFNWTKNTYTYIDFERTNGGDVKENYRWNVGVRHNF